MANNKVQLSNGTVVIDLSNDTVTSAAHIKSGLVGHLADGTSVTGTLVEKDVKAVTYNLTGGVTASLSTSEVVTGQGFAVRLKAPAGYNLSGVTVTMGGVDITSSVFEYDETGEGGGGGSITIEDVPNATGTTLQITTDGSGGGVSATEHDIYFEFSDSTNATIPVYYDDALISTMITAYTPEAYDSKTVTLAQLDGVTWYEVASGIPLNTELIDFAASTNSVEIDEYGQVVASDSWYYASDYTAIDPSMTFSFVGTQWGYLAVYDSSKTFVRSFYMNDIADSTSSNSAYGTLSGSRIANGYYVRITAQGNTSSAMSLIRTA